jgi:hypothetical protein
MKTKNVHQAVTLKANPKEVYHVLMNSGLHSEIVGSKAVIGTKAGSTFSVWDGGINGYNLALEPKRKSFRHGAPKNGRKVTIQSRFLNLKKLMTVQCSSLINMEFRMMIIKILLMVGKITIGLL